MHSVLLSGVLLEKESRRYSPAGVAFLSAQMRHEDEVIENNIVRKIAFELPILAAGEMAFRLESLPLGEKVIFKGFLAPRQKKQKRLVFHIQSIEFLKGT